MTSKSFFRWTLVLLLVAWGASCNEFEDPPPASPIVPEIPASRFLIDGHWEGVTDQGRPIRFDVTNGGLVVDSTIAMHHDCSGGRLVLQLTGYEAAVNQDSFTVTMNWRRDEDTKYYTGRLTVSGRFESSRHARGGFVNSVTDKQADNLGVCPAAAGAWEAFRN